MDSQINKSSIYSSFLISLSIVLLYLTSSSSASGCNCMLRSNENLNEPLIIRSYCYDDFAWKVFVRADKSNVEFKDGKNVKFQRYDVRVTKVYKDIKNTSIFSEGFVYTPEECSIHLNKTRFVVIFGYYDKIDGKPVATECTFSKMIDELNVGERLFLMGAYRRMDCKERYIRPATAGKPGMPGRPSTSGFAGPPFIPGLPGLGGLGGLGGLPGVGQMGIIGGIGGNGGHGGTSHGTGTGGPGGSGGSGGQGSKLSLANANKLEYTKDLEALNLTLVVNGEEIREDKHEKIEKEKDKEEEKKDEQSENKEDKQGEDNNTDSSKELSKIPIKRIKRQVNSQDETRGDISKQQLVNEQSSASAAANSDQTLNDPKIKNSLEQNNSIDDKPSDDAIVGPVTPPVNSANVAQVDESEVEVNDQVGYIGNEKPIMSNAHNDQAASTEQPIMVPAEEFGAPAHKTKKPLLNQPDNRKGSADKLKWPLGKPGAGVQSGWGGAPQGYPDHNLGWGQQTSTLSPGMSPEYNLCSIPSMQDLPQCTSSDWGYEQKPIPNENKPQQSWSGWQDENSDGQRQPIRPDKSNKPPKQSNKPDINFPNFSKPDNQAQRPPHKAPRPRPPQLPMEPDWQQNYPSQNQPGPRPGRPSRPDSNFGSMEGWDQNGSNEKPSRPKTKPRPSTVTNEEWGDWKPDQAIGPNKPKPDTEWTDWQQNPGPETNPNYKPNKPSRPKPPQPEPSELNDWDNQPIWSGSNVPELEHPGKPNRPRPPAPISEPENPEWGPNPVQPEISGSKPKPSRPKPQPGIPESEWGDWTPESTPNRPHKPSHNRPPSEPEWSGWSAQSKPIKQKPEPEWWPQGSNWAENTPPNNPRPLPEKPGRPSRPNRPVPENVPDYSETTNEHAGVPEWNQDESGVWAESGSKPGRPSRPTKPEPIIKPPKPKSKDTYTCSCSRLRQLEESCSATFADTMTKFFADNND